MTRNEDAPSGGDSIADRVVTETDFRGKCLDGADFRGTVFHGKEEVCFEESTLRGADFTGAVFKQGVCLSECDLSGACFKGCSVWKGINLDDSCAREAVFEDALMGGIICMMADFSGANLRRADLYWALASEAVFTNADLTDTMLAGGTFQGTDFSEALLRRTCFGDENRGGMSEMPGANLSSATIEDAIFDGCWYDSSTRFPEGFIPGDHGMKWMECRESLVEYLRNASLEGMADAFVRRLNEIEQSRESRHRARNVLCEISISIEALEQIIGKLPDLCAFEGYRPSRDQEISRFVAQVRSTLGREGRVLDDRLELEASLFYLWSRFE